MEPPLTLLYSPFPSPDSARLAATALLTERLVACCNLLPGTESHYWWEGTLTQSTEVILIAKTSDSAAETARARLAALHPYACPAILTLPVTANQAFAEWVGEQLRD